MPWKQTDTIQQVQRTVKKFQVHFLFWKWNTNMMQIGFGKLKMHTDSYSFVSTPLHIITNYCSLYITKFCIRIAVESLQTNTDGTRQVPDYCIFWIIRQYLNFAASPQRMCTCHIFSFHHKKYSFFSYHRNFLGTSFMPMSKVFNILRGHDHVTHNIY